MRTMLKSKIHRATVTGADLHYEGSLTIDPLLMRAADILPHERVEIYNVNNGARISTYAIEGQEGKGDIIVNGAAARHASKGDLLIIVTFLQLDEEAARSFKPIMIYPDAHNRING